MSVPDYSQRAEDHRRLLIVVKQIGPQITPKLFNRIYDRISKVNEVSISDAQGMGLERVIRVRYHNSYPFENNEWGDFQAHRKVLGLITVGRMVSTSGNNGDTMDASPSVGMSKETTHSDPQGCSMSELLEMHNNCKEMFGNTMFDSRCLLVQGNTFVNTPDAERKDLFPSGHENHQERRSKELRPSSLGKESEMSQQQIIITSPTTPIFDNNNSSGNKKEENCNKKNSISGDAKKKTVRKTLDFNLSPDDADGNGEENNRESKSNMSNINEEEEEQLSSFHVSGEDIVDNFDFSERLPSYNLEPIPLMSEQLNTRLNIDSSDSSSPSSDEMNLPKSGTPSVVVSSASKSPTDRNTILSKSQNGEKNGDPLRSSSHLESNCSSGDKLQPVVGEQQQQKKDGVMISNDSESGSNSSDKVIENNAIPSKSSLANNKNTLNLNLNSSSTADANNKQQASSIPKNPSSSSIHSTSSSQSHQLTQCIRYNNEQECSDRLESDLKEFISSLFWVLESKRLDRSHEKQDRVPLLIAPFEKKDLVGLDTDTRTFRKKCLARMRKHLGDLSLLAGLPSESLVQYSAAIEQLRNVSDWLWLASALEGQCVASMVLLYPQFSRRRSIASFQRNSSLPTKHFSRNYSNSSNHSHRTTNNSLKQRLTGAVGSSSPSNENEDSSGSKSLPNGLDPVMVKALGKAILTPAEIYEKYKEAACHYAKYRNATILEFECSFKASRVLTFQEKYLQASEFIQNAVFISFHQTNDEQIERLSIIADLYADIGFLRKAAFYRRFSALKAVSTHLPNPNWEKCYFLLLPALEGYSLTLDPIEYQKRLIELDSGWPGIHLQLLQEMVTCAIRMNNEPLAVRHLSFVLHSLCDYLSLSQREEFAKKLMALSSRCGEGSPVSLKLFNGIVIPSVNLNKFPIVTSFKIQNLPSHYRPIKLKAKLKPPTSLNAASNPPSPFIFTPLNLNRIHKRTQPKTNPATLVQAIDFKWAQGEMCQILLQVQNVLPLEYHVQHMSAMTDGVPFETHPTSISLPPEQTNSIQVILSGTPLASGKLDVMGYSTHVLGVKNDCRLRDLPLAKRMKLPNCFTIDVIPPLPLMTLSCSLPQSNQYCSQLTSPATSENEDSIINSAGITLFAGEKRTCTITLTNDSLNGEMIEIINVNVTSKLPKESEKLLFEWNQEESINNELPLANGKSFSFDLTINAIGGFVVETSGKRARSAPPSVAATPHGSQHSSPMHTGGSGAIKKSQLLGSTTLANFINDLQASGSNRSQQQKEKREKPPPPVPVEQFPSKTIEAVVQFEYSGGSGLSSGYCRHCSMIFHIEIVPSLIITSWDVLPADLPSHCFLVLDTFNSANQEMELKYAKNKEILIEAKETCRIPIPIERCSLVNEDADAEGEIGDEDTQALLVRCKQHLVNQVQLKWTMPASAISGDASIVNVPWPDEMLKAVLLSPVQWDVQLNETSIAVSNELTFECGQMISLNISLSNCSANSLKSLSLSVHCYQDYQNNQRNYRLDMKRAIIGFDRVCIDEIESKQSYTHQCGLLFFHPGLYKLDIQCSGHETVSEANKQLQLERFNRFQRAHAYDDNYIAPIHQHAYNQHLNKLNSKSPTEWKCSPSIEITIE